MEIDELRHMTSADRWVFVRGRIATEAVDMDAALRGVHAALRNRHDRDALLEAKPAWSTTLTQCKAELQTRGLSDEMRDAAVHVLDDAGRMWNERNRYMHDLLVVSIDIDDAPPVFTEPRAEDDRYLLRLARVNDAPESVSVSLDSAIQLVLELVAVTWRLRALRFYLAKESGGWRGMLLGHVEGVWDGTADIVSNDDDD